MNIVWATRTAVVGGAEHATLVLARQLRARGHRVDVLCRPDSPLAPAAAETGLARPSQPPSALGMARALASRTEPLLLITSIADWIAACLARSMVPDSRLVLVRHMALPVSLPLRWLAGRRADAIVAVSAAVREQLAVGSTIRRDRLHLISNPSRIPVRAAPPTADERRAARARLGVAGDSRVVAYLGGAVAAKGPADALAAVRRAGAVVGPVHLLACGARADADSPWRAAGPLVRDLGRVTDVETVLAAADALLVPTHRRLSEAMPLVVIEAMACGTPVIAYAVGGIPEALADSCGRLVEPERVDLLGDALIEVLSDPPAAQAMATRALTRAAAMFAPARIADQYEALFATLRP